MSIRVKDKIYRAIILTVRGAETWTVWFQRLPPARGGTAQKKIIHLANWSQLIHPGPASSLTKVFFGVESVMRVNADSLLIRAAATSTSGTLNDLTTDLIMANNNNNMDGV